jgi:hypothetical protein
MISLYAMFGALSLGVVIANGFGRRFAGGLLSQWVGPIGGTQVARVCQALIVGLSVLVMSGLWEWALAAVLLAWVGATWGFPEFNLRPPFVHFEESRMEARNLLDTIGLSLNGVVACAPLALGAWWVGLSPWFLLMAGVARGPAWWLAALVCPRWRWLGTEKWVEKPVARWVLMPTALAEFYSGMALGLGIVLTLVLWS